MKKTLNINIGNSIIHIEEDAYEILTAYLIEVKQHFGKSADDFEIVSDIENRIAEMFSEILLAQQKPVIELEDVQAVIQLMGSVKDFEGEAEEEPARAYSQHSGFTASGERKIYRDSDDAMVAGVCSGLSHYLQMDVSILRIIAALTILLGGSGIIAYLILWVAIPKANTRAEKMAMKGEAANLQGFKRSFEEELSGLKESLRGANDELRPLIKRSGSFIAEFVEVLGVFLQGAGKTIIKVIAVIMVIWASLVFLAAVIAVAAILGFWDSSASAVFPLSMVDAAYRAPFILALFVVIAVPMIALVLLSIRVAFNTRTSNKMVSYGLLLIWLCGLSVGIFYVAKVGAEFKEEAEFTQNIAVKKYPEYTLELDKSRFFSKEDSLRYRLNTTEYHGRIIMNDRDAPFRAPRNVTIRIEKGDSDIPSLVETYGSQGINFETALYHAKNIRYDFSQQDSVLRFSPELHLNKNTNWRNQRVELVLRVPVGAKVNISRNMDRYLQDYSLWDCGNDDRDEPYHGVMTTEGLTCRDHQ